MKIVTAHPITQAAFAPYGWLVDASAAQGVAINGASSLRFDGLSELALHADGGKPCLAIFKATARDPAGPWAELERHQLGTQTFIPLNGVRYLALVSLGADEPDASTLAAFVVEGHQAITLRAGTWHHGLLALVSGDFAVIDRQAAQIDCEIVHLAEPVSVVLA